MHIDRAFSSFVFVTFIADYKSAQGRRRPMPSNSSYITRSSTETLPETHRKIHTKHDMKDTRQVNVKMVRLEVHRRFVEPLAQPEIMKTCTSTCTSSHQNQATFNTRRP
jgi:hypothetical protein